MRNLLLVINMLGAIDPQQLRTLTRAVPPALHAMTEPAEPPGLWTLISGFLWNRDIRRALAVSSNLLKTIGKQLAAPRAEQN